MQSVFSIIEHSGKEVPIVLSIPHAGTTFPGDIGVKIKREYLPADDTDWFVDQLYGFATDLGITIIKANYSRWVIDLNRNPDNKPLYNDGRWITGLCPTTDFLGNNIYKDERAQIDEQEVAQRKSLYFNPYHQQVQLLLDAKKKQFGKVLLWDCHSIRRNVSSIHKESFPDLILGSADDSSASKEVIHQALESLRSTKLSVSHNHPFKGGFITRYFGRPELNQHALQLEMSKDVYMDGEEINYNDSRAATMQDLLKNTFEKLIPLLF